MRLDDGNRGRGRPSSPPGSSLGEYLRGLRLARGWTIRDLAARVGLPSSSASYISQLESGTKTPHESLAVRLAEQLGDEKGVFRLWALTGRRKEPTRAAAARRELARLMNDPTLMHDPRFTHPGFSRFEESSARLAGWVGRSLLGGMQADSSARWIAHEQADGHDSRDETRETGSAPEPSMLAGFARPLAVRVPILSPGEDPDSASASMPGAETTEPGAFETVRLDSAAQLTRTLVRPFAYRVTPESIPRLASLLHPGDVVVFTREPGPVLADEIYAVRHAGKIELAHLLWNGRQLLLLPDVGKSDFVLLDAHDDESARRLIAGHMVTVIRGGTAAE